MIRDYRGKTPKELYKAIVTSFEAHNYTYIIMGRSGPTGKSTLCNKLKEFGLQAFEISESVRGLVDFYTHIRHFNIPPHYDKKYDKEMIEYEKDNHMIVDGRQKVVTIILNEPVILERYGE